MAFGVVKLLVSHDSSSNGLNSYGFRQYIESYILRLRSDKGTNSIIMTPIEGTRFNGDLSGWLSTQNIPYDYHWIIGRINGYLDPSCYYGDKLNMLIPNTGLIDSLLVKYKNSLN